jgi:hypothetical protein
MVPPESVVSKSSDSNFHDRSSGLLDGIGGDEVIVEVRFVELDDRSRGWKHVYLVVARGHAR